MGAAGGCDEEGRLGRGAGRRRRPRPTDPPSSAGGGRAVPGHTPLGRTGCSRLHSRLGRPRGPPRRIHGHPVARRGDGIRSRRGLDLPRRWLLRRIALVASASGCLVERVDRAALRRARHGAVRGRGTAGTTRLRSGPVTRRGAAGQRRWNALPRGRSAGSHHCSRAVGELCTGHGKTVPAGALGGQCRRCAASDGRGRAAAAGPAPSGRVPDLGVRSPHRRSSPPRRDQGGLRRGLRLLRRRHRPER